MGNGVSQVPPPPHPLHPSVRTCLNIFASHRLRPPHSECLVGSKYSQAGPKAKRYLINLPLHQRYHFDGYFQEASLTCDKYPATKRVFRPASLLSFGSELDRYLAKARRTASRNEAFDACLSDSFSRQLKLVCTETWKRLNVVRDFFPLQPRGYPLPYLGVACLKYGGWQESVHGEMQRSRYLITWQALYFASSAPRMLRPEEVQGSNRLNRRCKPAIRGTQSAALRRLFDISLMILVIEAGDSIQVQGTSCHTATQARTTTRPIRQARKVLVGQGFLRQGNIRSPLPLISHSITEGESHDPASCGKIADTLWGFSATTAAAENHSFTRRHILLGQGVIQDETLRLPRGVHPELQLICSIFNNTTAISGVDSLSFRTTNTIHQAARASTGTGTEESYGNTKRHRHMRLTAELQGQQAAYQAHRIAENPNTTTRLHSHHHNHVLLVMVFAYIVAELPVLAIPTLGSRCKARPKLRRDQRQANKLNKIRTDFFRLARRTSIRKKKEGINKRLTGGCYSVHSRSTATKIWYGIPRFQPRIAASVLRTMAPPGGYPQWDRPA
ncbi:uncharacterized protein CLUP02_16491 [Colletotrichum lupini]|uniref:Uncharacterized protein n=1 Tax=Colletotrichum lupini TaxID=145971 RepID=A0A9Q8T7Y4_9PEZI|nr:uncharacterized protein CLUP02_16491 [Colletotrichum lupini]UQC90959.1 hypothetical protein CLUP02_16491 [Colletotrichum lupini]